MTSPLFSIPKLARRMQSAASISGMRMFVVGAGQKAPAIEGAMPAGGTIAAADCRERRYRHIPLKAAVGRTSSVVILQQVLDAPKGSSVLVGVISA
jgi:hypothetical protein